jgi:thiol:disulfide interchange protein
MFLDRDEFVVSYDPKKATPQQLIATIKEAGYTAQVITGRGTRAAPEPTLNVLPPGFPLLDDALTQARRERKLIILDFSAEWCAPCKRMEKTTFADAKVKELLARCVLVKIDTDREEELSQRLGVVGLPYIHFVSPGGKVLHRLRGFQSAEILVGELARLIQSVER